MRTFAPELGIVPFITIKHYFIMVTEDLCKVTIGSVIYRVREYRMESGTIDHYAVLSDRRLVKGGSWFTDYRQAVMFMLRVSFNDVAQLSLEGLL